MNKEADKRQYTISVSAVPHDLSKQMNKEADKRQYTISVSAVPHDLSKEMNKEADKRQYTISVSAVPHDLSKQMNKEADKRQYTIPTTVCSVRDGVCAGLHQDGLSQHVPPLLPCCCCKLRVCILRYHSLMSIRVSYLVKIRPQLPRRPV